jgi:hypothetical protein
MFLCRIKSDKSFLVSMFARLHKKASFWSKSTIVSLATAYPTHLQALYGTMVHIPPVSATEFLFLAHEGHAEANINGETGTGHPAGFDRRRRGWLRTQHICDESRPLIRLRFSVS